MESKIITVSRYIYNSIIKLITPRTITKPKVDIIHDYKIKLMEEGKFKHQYYD
jgi:hypothetical protein